MGIIDNINIIFIIFFIFIIIIFNYIKGKNCGQKVSNLDTHCKICGANF
jgi:hypothetical protein